MQKRKVATRTRAATNKKKLKKKASVDKKPKAKPTQTKKKCRVHGNAGDSFLDLSVLSSPLTIENATDVYYMRTFGNRLVIFKDNLNESTQKSPFERYRNVNDKRYELFYSKFVSRKGKGYDYEDSSKLYVVHVFLPCSFYLTQPTWFRQVNKKYYKSYYLEISSEVSLADTLLQIAGMLL